MIKHAVGLLMAGTTIALYWNYGDLLTLTALKTNRDYLDAFINSKPLVAGSVYATVMALIIGLTCPGATTLSFTGGVLFPQPYAAIFAYIGYVAGAALSFTAVRYLFQDTCRRRLKDKSIFKKFEQNAKKNIFMYVILARYTMVFPFWFVNSMCAIIAVPFTTFIGATLIAVIPGSLVYTTAGRVLGNMLDRVDVEEISKSQLVYEALFDPNVKICLAMLTLCLTVALIMSRMDKEPEPAAKED